VVREQTVKAVLIIVPKLTDRIVNGELLRHLAKTANDEQPGIRTNTTVCLGKIARNLGQASRTKVLTAAFARALRDPFVHARNAALMALAATADLFSEEDCATKILPGICPSLIDKEKLVRDQANKTLDLYMSRIRKYSQTLPDSAQPTAGAPAAGAAPRMGTPQSDSSSWAGWAISSFTNKLAAASGQMQAPSGSGTAAAPSSQRASSVPPAPSKPHAPTPSAGLRAPKAAAARPANPFAASDTALSSQASSARASTEDASTDWGAAWAEPAAADEPATDEPWGADGAWPDDGDGDAAPDPFAAKPAAAAPAATFDGDAEPDFASWLEAQARAKRKGGAAGAKALPKGLARAQRPAAGGAAAPKRAGALPARKKAAAAAAREQEEDEEGWGDAWE